MASTTAAVVPPQGTGAGQRRPGGGVVSPVAGDAGRRIVHCSNRALNAEFPTNKIRTTKYTLLTFLPLNLLEQFSRHINRYFLLIACLQLVSAITPVNPVTTWAPLIVIFGLSAAKEALDDFGRAKQDKIANQKKYKIIQDGELVEVESQEIHVGDIVKLYDGDQVPCDICILATSAPDGACFVQTMNLDGETNLKARTAVPNLQALDVKAIENFQEVLVCAPPDSSIYRFDSHIGNISLSGDQLIQQTTTIKNTAYVYGVAVYTGADTKFAQNKGTAHVKWTKVDGFINRVAIALFIFQLVIVAIFGAVGNVWERTTGSRHYYLNTSKEDAYINLAIYPLRFLLLISTIIPISLKVTLDVCKFFYAKFIGWDLRLFDDGVDEGHPDQEPYEPAQANNTSISEDLGQIQVVLTDKTGTLTENRMIFRKCSIKGALFTERECGSGGRLFLAGAHNESSVTLNFLRNIALNNSVTPSQDASGRLIYKSPSPDEESLVEAAAQLGVKLVSRHGPMIELNVHGQTESYLVRQELTFTSERRRMSVIVQDRATGNLVMYTKGGDDVIVERVASLSEEDRITVSHLNSFAGEGLRTLAFAQRYVDSNEFAAWTEKFNEANTVVHGREEALSSLFAEIEHDFDLCGASAIEDRLQTGVPDTIKTLRLAGIKFWMLTGDKFSTALQIATTCNLKSSLSDTGVLLEINAISEDGIHSELDAHHGTLKAVNGTRDVCVILRGASLGAALSSTNRDRFLALCLAANAVICCRFSPKQKAQVVRMVKDAGLMTLAIGDGGNDVSMIMEAHVGVGIRGREGLQAARAADYQINYFRSLQPLLLIHGRQSYLRTCLVAQYSYFKSFEFCIVQILFAFASGYSGSALFDSACIAAYNALLFVPILTFVFDQDIPGDQVLRVPEVYLDCQASQHFTWTTYLIWMFRGFFQAIVVYSGSCLFYNNDFITRNGLPADFETLGLLAFFSFLLVQSVTMFLELQYVTRYNVIGIVGFHILGCAMLYFASTQIAFDSLIQLGSAQFVFSDPVFWLANVIIVAAAILPVLAIQFIARQVWPDPLCDIRRQLLSPAPMDDRTNNNTSGDV
ncbi:unnamed protein product (mitochondrion) [Plasmodiophora brassicae]|uniref:Phospholipid-transporting ATPase n=1 Tax=Plasmodiophora brassicae TaxID=37360 RepID=A0A3P3Y2P0_PLABS|nr:unnamed protein product [Plasmodiophora brassicae]